MFRYINKKYSRPHTKTKTARVLDAAANQYSALGIYMSAAAQDDDMNSLSSEEPAEELTSMSLGMPAPRLQSSPAGTASAALADSADIGDISNSVSPKFKITETVKKKIRFPAGSITPSFSSSPSPSISRQGSGRLSKLQTPYSPEMRPKSPYFASSRGSSPVEGGAAAAAGEGSGGYSPSRPVSTTDSPVRPIAVASSAESAKMFSVAAGRRMDSSANNSGLGSVKRNIANSIFRPPFALIQLHRERLKMRPILGSRRPLRCYLRVCAMVGTCNEAKIAAGAQLFNLSIQAMGSKSDGLVNSGDRYTLAWSRFSGFSTMPLQNTDHFIIYCRGAPVEFASFTPPTGTDILDTAFPSVCRAAGQSYSCLSVFRVAAPRPQNVLSTNDLPIAVASHGGDEMRSVTLRDADAVMKPLFMKEMSCVAEVMSVSASRLDCLRYAFSLVEGTETQAQASAKAAVATNNKRNRWTSVPDSVSKKLGLADVSCVAEQRLVVVPMYAWLHISEDTFQYYDHAEFSADEIAEENRFVTAARNHMLPRLDMVVAKSELDVLDGAGKDNVTHKAKTVNEELKDAINAVGKMLNEGTDKLKAKADNRRANNFESLGQLSNSASAAILSKEKGNRALHSAVDGRMKQNSSTNKPEISPLLSPTLSRSANVNQTGKAKLHSSGSVDSLEDRLQALRTAVSSRQKVLSMNDELCHLEMRLAKQSHRAKPPAAKLTLDAESIVTYDPNGILTEQRNELDNDVNPYDLKNLQKQLSSKRVEIFGALQELPCRRSSSFDNHDNSLTKRAAFPSSAKFNGLSGRNTAELKKMSSVGSDHSSSIINLDGRTVTSHLKEASVISSESINGKLTAMESLFSA